MSDNDNFYRALEDRFRGTRKVIKERLRIYLPFIEPLLTWYPEASVLDLGCGRGEWLELLVESSFRPRGVDLDEGMLSSCIESGLEAKQAEALEALRAVPDASLVVVSAFHMVEHISFDHLRALVSEAHRVLMPGGVLILETPNPENLVVATSNFYLDPSHQRPIPPPLLSFVAEYAGFSRIKTIRLQEAEWLREHNAPLNLMNVFDGVSPDYAILAQKDGQDDIFRCNEAAFQGEYGLTLHSLAVRYTLQIEAHVRGAEARAMNAGTLAQGADVRSQDAEAMAQQAQAQAREADARARTAEELALQAAACIKKEAAPDQVLAQLQAVYASTSWRITAPLRWLVSIVQVGKSSAFIHIRGLLQRGVSYAGRRPWARWAISRVFAICPSLKSRLVRIAVGPNPHPILKVAPIPTELAHLSPHAREFYDDLKSAITRRRERDD